MFEYLKLLGTGASWLSVLPGIMYKSSHGDIKVDASKDSFDKELEKADILERAKSAAISYDLNSGPMLYGLSTSGTAIAVGSATYLGDWEYRYNMLRTAEMGAQTVKSNGERHYRLAEVAAVGEATALAMRSNVKR